MRGEKMTNAPFSSTDWGSPPHARGKDPIRECSLAQTGITPACAGKSQAAHRWRNAARDHPRMRGEKTKIEQDEQQVLGSPPHARGKVYPQASSIFQAGITPACAGKRRDQWGWFCGLWDHPRMRGEKRVRRGGRALFLGSPPHARGKVANFLGVILDLGITPACAGKSSALVPPGRAVGDHPRMRGEKLRMA